MRPTAQQARAALLVSLCMTLLGTCGVGSGLAGANQTSMPAPPQPAAEGEPVPELFLIAQASPLADALFESPLRRPLAAANAIASAMLLIASFMLTFRRPSTLWWVRNTVAANVLYSAASFGHIAYTLLSDKHALDKAIMAYSEAFPQFDVGDDSSMLIAQTIALAAVGALLSAAIHLALGIRCHRPDIRAFLDSATDTPAN